VPGITAPDRCADGRGGYVEPVGVGRQLTLIAVNLGVVGPGPGRTRSVCDFGVDPSAPTDLAEVFDKERTPLQTSGVTALTLL